MFGFHFRETMSGTWRKDDGVERPICFTVTARARSWLKHLRDKKAVLDGTITAEGLATGKPLTGELIIDPLFARIIRYELHFSGDDGRPYMLRGQKDVTLADPVGSMTTLPAEIIDRDQQTFGTAMLKFDARDLPSFLASFRPSF